MSIKAMAAVWLAPISPTSLKLTALSLADQCNDDGGSLHPSMATIAARVGVSRSQAQRLVHQLIELGLLSVVGNAAGGAPGMTPRYQLHLDRLPTGSTGATGRTDATGSADAVDGSHACTGRVASMRQTGRTDATQTVKNHQRTIKEPKGEQRSRAKHPIPADWTPDAALLEWAREQRPDLNLQLVAENFRDHYLARGEARASWDASFRTWVRREGAQGSRINSQERLEAGNRAVAARFLRGEAARSKHSGFAERDYHEGIGPNGELLP